MARRDPNWLTCRAGEVEDEINRRCVEIGQRPDNGVKTVCKSAREAYWDDWHSGRIQLDDIRAKVPPVGNAIKAKSARRVRGASRAPLGVSMKKAHRNYGVRGER